MFGSITLAAFIAWLFTPWGLGAILAVVLFFDSEVPTRIVRAVQHRSRRRTALTIRSAAEPRTEVPAA
jgi:hypothetical protein